MLVPTKTSPLATAGVENLLIDPTTASAEFGRWPLSQSSVETEAAGNARRRLLVRSSCQTIPLLGPLAEMLGEPERPSKLMLPLVEAVASEPSALSWNARNGPP